MSLNLNKVILAGRIVAEPELKQTASGISVVSFRIAVNRRSQQQNEADFFNVTAWQNTAEFIAKYFHKGSAICVCGRIQNRTYTDQNGQKRTWTDIVAEEVQFVDSRSESSNAQAGGYAPDAYGAPAYSSPMGSAPKFEEIKTDDDLPF